MEAFFFRGGTIIRGQLSLGAIVREAIVWGAIVQEAIIRGAIVLLSLPLSYSQLIHRNV